MTSWLEDPGPYGVHRWAGGERALREQGRSQDEERPVG